MSFKRDSLSVLQNRTYANYISHFKPLDKTPRHNLLKVLAAIDSGIYHQLLGDLDFLAKQIFPDTAEGVYLREHWSSKITPLYAIAASGEVTVTGIHERSVPSGLIFQAASGERYFVSNACKLDLSGKAQVTVRAENTGVQGNLAAKEKLSIVSSIPAGIDSQAIVSDSGITGGADAESDEEYLVRVLAALRNPVRYGRKGDYALWALDSSAEISTAWEFWNFGVSGAVLIQVIKGNHANGIGQVGNLEEVRNYISNNSPPILFDVRTPNIISITPTAALPLKEDSQANRDLAKNRIKAYMQLTAKPGANITAGALRLSIIDGITITDCSVKINGGIDGIVSTTILECPYVQDVIWE